MKPAWLNKKVNLKACLEMKGFLRHARLETVCEQAMCPNIGECFSRRQATFLILGRHCTRGCSFCNIAKGLPSAPEPDEPARVADAVARLSLRHVVITSVTRDDLPDGGAGVFVDTVLSIRKRCAHAIIETLIPDFKLEPDAIAAVAGVPVDIVAHNIETVSALYRLVRQGSDYLRSLGVLEAIKKISPHLKTKSGLMLGLGETRREVVTAMQDLRLAGCDFLSLGQYLAPSRQHYPVKEYVTIEQFAEYKRMALGVGFLHVESGPYVRSSYLAGEYLKDGKIGQE